MPEIIIQKTDNELIIAKELFSEYIKFLDIDLNFQQIEDELNGLPGKYAEPEGCILLAQENNKYVGVVALRKLDEGICEMKRLYVPPAAQGKRIGRKLSVTLIEIAKTKGYHTMLLDTLGRLEAAVKLYESLGFERIEPYNFNPEADVLYFSKKL